jgi:carbon-monoxide dehydrogenase medium subunit
MLLREVEYARPGSVDEAIRLLVSNEGARALAGGQTLVNVMKARAASPDVLVDLNRLDDLRAISVSGGTLQLGAMATYTQIMDSSEVEVSRPILAEVAAQIADVQVRNRGTIGGSLAQADPHGDLPTVLLALDGEVSAEGPDGMRTIAASDLFLGFLTTSLRPDEILTGVRVPKAPKGAYVKFNRRAQDWAIVGVAAVVDGSSARIALTGVGPAPVRAEAAERAFSGGNAAEAAELAAEGLDPPADSAGSADYRRHLARVLTRRALEEASSG